MESRNRYDGVDAYAVTKIRYQARLLARSRAFSSADVEDLEQELILDLLRGLPAFDSSRGSRNTFIARLVENRAASLIKAATAEKRGCGIEHECLHAVRNEGDDDDCELQESIPDENALWPAGGRAWDEAIELRHDLANLRARLPEHLRVLCERLAAATVTEISRTTGRSTSSIYDTIAELRRTIVHAGAETYA